MIGGDVFKADYTNPLLWKQRWIVLHSSNYWARVLLDCGGEGGIRTHVAHDAYSFSRRAP